MNRLSATSIDTFYQCLLKYWFRYFSGEKPLEDSLALRFGTAVHAALEVLGKRLQKGEPLTEQLLEACVQDFISYAAKYRISESDTITEGIKFIRARMTRHNPAYRILDVELNFSKKQIFTPNGTPLGGKLDLVLEADPYTAIIIDYKTSKRAKTEVEAKTDIQLSMYDYMFTRSFPQYEKVWLIFDYLRQGVVITDRDEYSRIEFEKQLDAIWHAMGELKREDMLPTINVFCPWCDFRHLCSEYQTAISAEVQTKPIQNIANTEEFTSEWRLAKALEKIADNRLDELKQWAHAKVQEEGTTAFKGKGTQVSWTQSSRTTIDPALLIPHIPTADLVRLVSFKKGELESYIENERPDLKVFLEQAYQLTPGAPRISTKAVK